MATKGKQQDELLEDIQENLQRLVNLIALLVASDKSVTEAARSLKMAGLDNKTIASILNTSPNTISVLTANLRVKMHGARS